MYPPPGPRLNPKLFDRRIRTALGLSIDEPKVYYTPMNYGKVGKSPLPSQLSEAQINQAIASALFPSIQSKKAVKAFHDSLSDHYMLRIIKQSIYHDVFYKFVDNNNLPAGLPVVVNASSENVKNKIVETLEETRLSEIVKEILDATLYLGEYLLFFDDENFQVDETFLDQTSWRAVYQRGALSKIVAYSNVKDDIESMKDKAIIFRIKYLPFKIPVLGEDEYPFYAYIGQGIIGIEILNLINTIRLIETLLPINQVLNVAAGQLVYARFPEGPTNIGEAFDIARQYERLLNASVETSSNTTGGPISIQDIISSVAKWRVIPLFGDKGSLEPRELPRPNPIDVQTINYFKQALADAIPLPSSYLGVLESGGEGPDRNKLAQYYTMITEIRSAIADLADVVISKAIHFKKIRISGEYSILPIQVSGILENQMGDYFELASFVMDSISRSILSIADVRDRSAEYVNMEIMGKILNQLFYPLTLGDKLIKIESLSSSEEEEIGGEEEVSLPPEEEEIPPEEGEELPPEEEEFPGGEEENEGNPEEGETSSPEEDGGRNRPKKGGKKDEETTLSNDFLDNLFR
jgi:hypothetical protein